MEVGGFDLHTGVLRGGFWQVVAGFGGCGTEWHLALFCRFRAWMVRLGARGGRQTAKARRTPRNAKVERRVAVLK